MINISCEHFAFEVSNLDRALDFYCEVLGCTLLRRTGSTESGGEQYAFVGCGGVMCVELIEYHADGYIMKSQKAQEPFAPHIAFRTDDIDGLLQHLLKYNVSIVSPPSSSASGTKFFYATDPDGNIIEFLQRAQ